MKWIPIVFAAVLAAGCNDDGDPIPDDEFVWLERANHILPPLDPPAACDAFTAELRIIDTMQQPATTFIQGERILFELHVTNTSNVTRTITTGSGPQVRFFIVDGTRLIAGDSLRHAWPAVLVDYTYAPGETKLHQWVWDQVMDNGAPTPVGDYDLYADERTQCRSALSRTTTISIQ